MCNKIKISGFPWFFCGWNNIYYKIGENEYRMEPYVKFCIFPINGVTIKKYKNNWHFVRDEDYCIFFTKDSENLFGIWQDKYYPGVKFNVSKL